MNNAPIRDEALYAIIQGVNALKAYEDEVEPGDFFIGASLKMPETRTALLTWRIWRALKTIAPRISEALMERFLRSSFEKQGIRLGRILDGSWLAKQAIKQGASYALVEDHDRPQDDRFLFTESIRSSLQGAAVLHRDRLTCPIVAVTGSNGKTTTTQLIQRVLAERYRVSGTRDSYNSQVGCPRMLLTVPLETELAVLEMGAFFVGLIDTLARMARPTHALITNIGKSHLGSFGSVEQIQAAKWELIDYVNAEGGHSFINLNDPWLAKQTDRLDRYTSYGSVEGAMVYGTVVGMEPAMRIRWYPGGEGRPYLDIQTQFIGQHYLENVMAAIAVGTHFEVAPEAIQRAIEGFAPLVNRLQVLDQGSNRIILDSNSVSPENMRAAIDTLTDIDASYKVAILAGSRSLGPYADGEHQQILDYAIQCKFDELILFGDEFDRIKNPHAGAYFKSPRIFKEWYLKQNYQNATILIKTAGYHRFEELVGIDYQRY